jgi:hypothetical protein
MLSPIRNAEKVKSDKCIDLRIQRSVKARRFHAEIILRHVEPPLSYPAGAFESGRSPKIIREIALSCSERLTGSCQPTNAVMDSGALRKFDSAAG